jgi:hypothetical protein
MAVSARFLTTPLGVDLAGTLIRSDILLESLLLLLKQKPLHLFSGAGVVAAGRKGRTHGAARLAGAAQPGGAAL